jgi:hypothetical protein
MAIAEIILDKLTDRKNFDKISNLVDCAQHDFKVSDLRFTRDSFHSYPFPNMAETQQHIDLFWKEMQNTYEELMPAEYFQTIYHKDAPQMRLSKDIERCDIFLDGQKLQRNQAIDMPLIEGFLKAKFPAFASDSKLNDYLKALFTQGVYTFATQTMTKKLSPKGCFYQNLKYEVYANSKQEEVILKARFILRSMDYQTLAINEEIEVEIHAPYDHNKPGRCIYTRVQG